MTKNERMNITAYYVESHFNANAMCVIPGYWTPHIASFRGASVFPCDTEAEAIEVGRKMVENGQAEAL